MRSVSGLNLSVRAGALVGLAAGFAIPAFAQQGRPDAGGESLERRSSVVQRGPVIRDHQHMAGRPGGAAQFPLEYRTIDGSFNNPANPEWGSVGVPFLRLAPSAYADGVSAPAGPGRPSARAVSNALHATTGDKPNFRGASDYLWQWGQFLDHDVTETPIAGPAEHFDIAVPTGDPWFDTFGMGGVTIGLDRSFGDMTSGVREQINNITAFVDASNVYASEHEVAEWLRTHDGTGKLKTSEGDLLPFNTEGFPNAMSTDPSFFLGGDIRANEQTGLTAMHTLFVREHNYWAEQIATANPGLSGDEIYEHARAIVGAEMQAITYNEFLPVLLGPNALPPYSGWNPGVNPSISNEFATAAYRVGHTMLSGEIKRLNADGSEIAAGSLALADAFFNPQQTIDEGITPTLRGLASQAAQEIDNEVVGDVRNFLFGAPGMGGFDLASLNIQRGRDHGLASYNQIRVAMGMAPAMTFADVNPDPAMQTKLAAAYANPGQIDAWSGLLSEPRRPGAMVGETLFRVLVDQFVRLRDGDRFWYESYLSPEMVQMVELQTLGVIIRRNTGIGDELQHRVFMVGNPNPADLNGDGVLTGADFNRWIQAFQAGSPAADQNQDGRLTGADFNAWVSNFMNR